MPSPQRPQRRLMTRRHSVRAGLRAAAAIGALAACGFPCVTWSQITPGQASQLRDAIGDRIEALTILGGDYGIAAATFRSTGKFSFGETTDATLTVTKLGGSCDSRDLVG